MTRTTARTLLGVTVAGLGLALTACGTVVAQGNPTGPSGTTVTTTTSADAGDSADPSDSVSASTTTATTSKNSGTGTKTTTTTKPTTTTHTTTTTNPGTPQPKLESFTVLKAATCGAHGPGYNTEGKVTIAWKITGAPGAAIAVDNPGVYGAYGSDYPAQGQLELNFPCGATPGTIKHTYTIWPKGYKTLYKTITATAQNNP